MERSKIRQKQSNLGHITLRYQNGLVLVNAIMGTPFVGQFSHHPHISKNNTILTSSTFLIMFC